MIATPKRNANGKDSDGDNEPETADKKSPEDEFKLSAVKEPRPAETSRDPQAMMYTYAGDPSVASFWWNT